MIEKIYTPKITPLPAAYTFQFKFIAILLIVDFCKNASVQQIQLYLWGLQSEENLATVKLWKKNKRITNVSWVLDEDIVPLITQLIKNQLLKYEMKQKKDCLELGGKASDFIAEINDLSLTSRLKEDLKEIGKIPKILCEVQSIELVF